MAPPADAHARDLCNSMIGVLLAHVRRVGQPGDVEEVLDRAGEQRPLAELEDASNWSGYEQVRSLFAAAAVVVGDPDIGQTVGGQLFSRYAASEVVELLRSLERPAEVLRVVADIGTKQSAVTTMSCLEADDYHAVVTARTKPEIRRDRIFCGYTAGVVGAIPAIFGMREAEVTETACQARGDDCCVFRMVWDPSTATDPAARVHFLTAQVSALSTRFEALEQMASDLTSVSDVDEALQIIAERAGVAIRAPQFVLAVRLPGDDDLRIHHVGLDEASAAAYARQILLPRPDDHDGARLIVDVGSTTNHYGRIAAFYPEGRRFLAEERKLFEAYAGHAAAALDTAAALEEARERARLIGALFELTTSLSEVRTVGEVADVLCEKVPAVARCEQAFVLVWEADDGVLVLHGCQDGPSPRGGAAATGTAGRAGQVRRMSLDPVTVDAWVRTPAPLAFGAEPSGAETAEIARLTGLSSGAVLPVVARDRLLGLVVVSEELTRRGGGRGPGRDAGRDRLDGIARIAATAFDNAKLLDQIRHQARHDPLTDLPNSRMLEEVAGAALANARRQGNRVALMFVDLDHFKQVNDELGHHAGDAVLVEAANRLRTAVRAGDTVGRIGGDEFGVLMPHLADPKDVEVVADRILETFALPIAVGGTDVLLSVSVGITVAEGGADGFERMLQRADAAMYLAKAEGRGCYRLDTTAGSRGPSLS